MNEEIVKKRLILDLAAKDLAKIMNTIDGKNIDYSTYKVKGLNESDFLDLEIKLITETKERLENIFKK